MNQARGLRLAACGCFAMATVLAACDPPRPSSRDELTIVVQADRRELEAQQKSLKQREEALRGEQQQLALRIKELADSRAQVDLEHRRRFDDELARARDAEGELTRRAQALQQQRVEMEVQRSALAAPEGEQRSGMSVREAMVAAREARLAAREASLAAREAEVGAREKAVSAKESQLAGASGAGALVQQAMAVSPAPVAQPRDVPSRASVELRHKKLLAEMSTRGVLVSDLPAEAQPLNAEVFAARRLGDYARAADLLAELARAFQRLRIDQRFVEQKMVRLQGVRASARLAVAQKSEVEQLLRDVTSSYSDGQYEKANRGLNRIAAILDASGDAG